MAPSMVVTSTACKWLQTCVVTWFNETMQAQRNPRSFSYYLIPADLKNRLFANYLKSYVVLDRCWPELTPAVGPSTDGRWISLSAALYERIKLAIPFVDG